MGTLTEVDKEYLAQNFAAFFRRDYKRVAELHIESGWAPATTRVDELESAIRACCEPYFDRPLKELSLGMVLMRLFQTSRRFQVEIQPQLVLLQKTLLNVEGLGRQLDPDLVLSIRRKNIEDSVDSPLGIICMQCTQNEVTGFGGCQRRLNRLEISHLADHDDVWILSESCKKGVLLGVTI